MKQLLKGGHVWNGESLIPAHILIEDRYIVDVDPYLDNDDAEVVDVTGHLVCPGFTDLHVHLRQPGFTQKETIASGTAAAAAGGFTTVCAMPNLAPVPDELQHLQPQLTAIEKDALVRVLPYGALTVGEKGSCPADIATLGKFVCGFSDDGRGVQSEEMMRRVMHMVRDTGTFLAAHCEDESEIAQEAVTIQENSPLARQKGYVGVNNKSEWAEVERDIRLAEETGCPLHICHTSTAQSFALVAKAKAKGLPVTCEVTPHNLLLCCEDIAEDDGRFKMNPPLRADEDREAALAALLDGTVDAIATDHAPHTAEEKAGGFATALNGVVGLETAFPVLYTHLVEPGILPLERLLQVLIDGPAKVLGKEAPALVPGEKATLTVLDINTYRPVETRALQTRGKATPFEGWDLTGWPVLTLYEGKTVWDQKQQLQKLKPICPWCNVDFEEGWTHLQYPLRWFPYGKRDKRVAMLGIGHTSALHCPSCGRVVLPPKPQ